MKVTGFTDREVRRLIADARRDTVIINHQDGKGYYKTSNKAEIERYIKQESKRARTIFYRLKGARKALQEVDNCG